MTTDPTAPQPHPETAMTDLTPEIEPAARQFAEDMTLANRMPFAALVMRQARAMSLIRHLMRSRRKWQGEAEFMLRQASNNACRWGASEIRLAEARQLAAWFAAEAAYWKTEADLYHTVAAQNYESDGATAASLDAERTELQARVAELSDGQGNLIRKLSKASARVAELERVVEDQVSEISDKGVAITRLRERVREREDRIAELEAAQDTPDAYIAVKRYHAVSADGPEWCDDAAVIPAGHIHAWEREDHQRRGYQLLPIVADGDGTRFAAAQPAEPLGYAVAVDVDGGRIVQTSAVLPKSVAVNRAENYRTEFGMTTSVVEPREVSGE